MHYSITRTLIWISFKILFQIKIERRAQFPAKGQPFVFASNHLSYFDPAILSIASPRRLCFFGKEELFKNKLLAFAVKAYGTFPVKRGESDIAGMRNALKILKKYPVVVFPQGTRGASLDQINPGVGFLCKKAKVPIMVAKIYGSDKILPKGAKFPKIAKLRVITDKVDYTSKDTYEEIAKRVMEKIKSL
ncbi:MAG: 1-acyl-sn-glycerol-3-phosphate acyltransferase [Candidatus Omnitrophica bacterium]|nr:1-acyl-sn-glycerol-3-phosphate acyltransferase [Candidatus Omnitrophota bacterium]